MNVDHSVKQLSHSYLVFRTVLSSMKDSKMYRTGFLLTGSMASSERKNGPLLRQLDAEEYDTQHKDGRVTEALWRR